MNKIMKDNSSSDQNTIITPGGPKPKDRVQLVKPGEAVRIDESGKARIMTMIDAGTAGAPDVIITPGGARPRSQVHLIEPGHVLDGSDNRLRKINPAGKVIAEFRAIAPRPGRGPLMPRNVAFPSGKLPALGSGWITYAYWANDTGNPISSFVTTWTVPPAPSTQSGQLIYLFNGIQNSTMIYQPVLQWGSNGGFGGNYWLVASWYADGQGGAAFYSQPVQVNEGDVIVGAMTLTAQSGNLFSYNCEFQGIANSGLPIQNVEELTWCAETLEAYAVTGCSDYPNTPDTAMSAIAIQTGNSTPAITWTPVNSVTDCSQSTVVVSNSATNGEVDLYYRPVPTWRSFVLAPDGAASVSGKLTAVSRIPGSMEMWWIGGDGSVQGAYWYEGSQWQRYQLAPAGSASTTGGITALSRLPNTMEVWWIGTDGSIQDAFWYDGGQWQRFELAPAGSASTSSGIKGVHRIASSIELWWVGTDGSIQDAFWYEGGQWQRFQLAPPGSASPNTGIGAVSRLPNTIEIWWIAANGAVQDAFWYDGAQWQWFELAPAGSASTDSGIAAVSRVPNSMEIWWAGADGSIQDAYWYEGSQWQRFELAPSNSASTGGDITGVSRIPTSMEIWWLGSDGSVQDAFWYDGGQWSRFELAPTRSASTGGGIASVSRIPSSLEIWWIGANGSIQDAFWYG
jgi:hypothetical protein